MRAWANAPSGSTRISVYETIIGASRLSRSVTTPTHATTELVSSGALTYTAAAAGLGLASLAVKKVLDTPSRAYDNNVGEEYDAWTDEGILEFYWGEHIHLGYYSDEVRSRGYKTKDFKQAKFDFVDEMLKFSGANDPKTILDVGCGIGGTSRYLAKKLPGSHVEAITLSSKQVQRAKELAGEQSVRNVGFQVMDALAMDFPDNSFDLVWACESGEHMPDKKKYVEEMMRVLKPGGRLVIACWCQREDTPDNPLTEDDKKDLKFLYEEWAHPFFISKEEFGRIMKGTGNMDEVTIQDWTSYTLPSWRHSNWVGVWNPLPVIRSGPVIWYKVVREIVTIERMHQAFSSGLMQYGMMTGVKNV